MLNCADIIFNCASPHLQIRGGGFRSSAPHCEFRGENGLDQLGFNCAVISILLVFFPRFGHLLPIYVQGQRPKFVSPAPLPIVNSGFETVSINWVPIALNCEPMIFDRTRLLSLI